MKIFIKNHELPEFKQLVKENKIRHGPFRRHYSHIGRGQFHEGYCIEILEAGAIETYFRLKYNQLTI